MKLSLRFLTDPLAFSRTSRRLLGAALLLLAGFAAGVQPANAVDSCAPKGILECRKAQSCTVDTFTGICFWYYVRCVCSGDEPYARLSFEDLPGQYQYCDGAQNLGGYYSGVTFGPYAWVLDRGYCGYNDAGYPPCDEDGMGDAVLASNSQYSYIRADFAMPAAVVGMCYSSNSDLYFEAYASNGTLLGSEVGPANYGSSGDFQILDELGRISYVIIHDTGDFFTIDDVRIAWGVGPTPVAEASWGKVKAIYYR